MLRTEGRTMVWLWIFTSAWLFVTDVSSVTIFNAALGKNVSLSSLYPQNNGDLLTGDKSVDGNTDTRLEYCASTAHYDLNVWWIVDLQKNYTVMSLTITNRKLYSDRLHEFTVTVSSDENRPGSICAQYPGTVPSGATVTVTCDQVTWGRYIKITKPVTDSYDILTLCEVQVMAIDRTYLLFVRKAGKPASSDVIDTMAIDLPTCVHTCKDSLDCLGVNYNEALNQCQLANSTDSEDTGLHKGWDFYVLMP